MLGRARADQRPFEISTMGAAAVIALMSIFFAGAAWMAAGARFSTDAFSIESALRRAVGAIAIAIRAPAPVLLAALILERWFPLIPDQRALTRGFFQDIAWYGVDYLRVMTWIPLQLALLIALKRYIMGDRELVADGVMPAPILWVIAILAGDFLAYWSHRLRHRFDVLWSFHAIHHSQRELNFFTQNRFHDLDIVIDFTIRALPLLMLNPGWLVIGIFSTISLAHFRLYHSNIRSNYGVLRYILVTPQSHRIHHGRDARQLNCNFGIFFSIWDHAFGTQYGNDQEYAPELGIREEGFPIEQGTGLRDLARIFAAQTLYPFRRIFSPGE
jgi:sterol desaturase/sphingolipid hydroxylase (fatty acid hydroxylase superfamily)